MATTRHRSLVETGGRKAFVRDIGLAHIVCSGQILRHKKWSSRMTKKTQTDEEESDTIMAKYESSNP